MKKSNKSKMDFLPNRLNKFSIRKFSSVGTASILIGSLMFLGNQANAEETSTAAADKTPTTEEVQATSEATYTIGDKTWYDYNKNNMYDAAEDKGIANIKVKVYEYGGALVGETVSDANGNWSISGLKNGKYKVSFEAPDLTYQAVRQNEHMGTGQNSVGPTDALFEINGSDNFNLDQGYIVPGYNIDDPGKIDPPKEEPKPDPVEPEPTPVEPEPTPVEPEPTPDTGTYSLGDKVWADKLEEDTKAPNNVQDADEVGIEGIKVTLHDYAGNFVGETYTDANGQYRFDNLPNGTYRVDFETPLGWSPVIANLGNEVIDSDGPVAVLADIKGANNMDVDQGYVNNGGGAVTPDPTPIPDPVKPDGKYSIGDKVWWDDQAKEGNLDNLQDANEAPVKGLKVTIKDESGNLIDTKYTDDNGHYQFDNLPNGTYIVNFHNPLDWQPVIANLEADLHDVIDSDGPTDVRVVINGASNFNVDQGYVLKTDSPAPVDPVDPPTDPVDPPTDPVTPPGGGEPSPLPLPPEVCTVVSIGDGTPGNLSIGNKVWWDANRNNMQDAGEHPVVGLRVSLRDYAGNTIDETYTNAWGEYAFHGLAEGTYIVNFHNPLDWSPVIANIEADLHDEVDSDGPTDVIVNLKDKSNANVDQGYYGEGQAGPDCDTGVTPPGDKDPVTPPGDKDPVTPPGDKDPVTPPGDKDPVTPPGDKDPVTPPGDKDPVTPPADNGGDDKGGDDNSTPLTPPTDSGTTPPASGNVDTPKALDTAQPAEGQLPDTGEASNAALATGAAAAALAGGALIVASRKRKEEEI
ncbi:SdrD B-like domain-containing protein [Macrococcus sp. EM39E]|uniref:SdrD B-like domain-containing protein n=1 Tax=Macrococcus animalis TaxID=3395467 RepID=UPI0039BE530F